MSSNPFANQGISVSMYEEMMRQQQAAMQQSQYQSQLNQLNAYQGQFQQEPQRVAPQPPKDDPLLVLLTED